MSYDGPNLVEEANSSGVPVRRYLQSLNIDDPLAILAGGITDYYEADGLSSVTSLTSSSGSLVATYTYDSFGNLIASTGSLTNPFRFTGREYDTETGLYFYRARQFDAKAGRFLSEDPKRFKADSNFYEYVFNSPVNYVDPYGLEKCQSGKCDCPGGRWVGGALAGDLGIKIGFYGRGVMTFAGALTCTSNIKLIVPFYTICTFRSVSYTKPPLTEPPPRGIGLDGGAGGGGLTCNGIHCREGLAGIEYGGFFELGPLWWFREGMQNSGGICTGFGGDAGAEISIGGGGFACNTSIPNH